MEFKIENDELVIIAGVIIVTHIIGGIVLYNLPINALVENFVGGKTMSEDIVGGFKKHGGGDDATSGASSGGGYEGFE